MSLPCTSEPISWLELERYALGESSKPEAISQHLRQCPGCEAAASSIRSDSRRMPGLEIPSAVSQRTRRWRWLLPLVPAAILLLLWVARPGGEQSVGLGVKGGDASLLLIRESGGALLDPGFFAAGDRFKVQVSCAPGQRSVRVVVIQGEQESSPLAPAIISCTNQVVLPGAFTLEGGPAEVCLHIDGDTEPVCVSVVPQP